MISCSSKSSSLNFDNKGATQYFYDNYLTSLEWPFEFNYIAQKPAQADVKLFFKNQGQGGQMAKFLNQTGQCFIFPISTGDPPSTQGVNITYHQYNGKGKGAEYAFVMRNSATDLAFLRKRRTIDAKNK